MMYRLDAPHDTHLCLQLGAVCTELRQVQAQNERLEQKLREEIDAGKVLRDNQSNPATYLLIGLGVGLLLGFVYVRQQVRN